MFKLFKKKSKNEKKSKTKQGEIKTSETNNYLTMSDARQNISVRTVTRVTTVVSNSVSENNISKMSTMTNVPPLPLQQMSTYKSPYNTRRSFSTTYQPKPNSSISGSRDPFKTEFHTSWPTRVKVDAIPFTPTRYPPLTNNTQSKTVLASPRAAESQLNSRIVVKVKKDKTFSPKSTSVVPAYNTTGKNRGKMLLINNIMFDNNESSKRNGAEVDEKNIKELFRQMGFQIEAHSNLTKKQMLSKISRYAQDSSLKRYDISVVVMMSHGDGNKEGQTKIFGTDNEGLNICDIVDKFNNKNCPALIDKPKVFLFNCCRGSQYQKLESDSPSSGFVHNDMLLGYSTLPGFTSLRNPEFGTWYTHAICKVFMEHAWNTHVEDLLKLVDNMLKDIAKDYDYKQTSSYENRGFKLCYLNPK